MLISPQAAIVESQRAYATTLRTVGRQGKFLHDPALADRLAIITGRLVGQAMAIYPYTRNWAWSVAFIDEPDNVNAWCMAGGKMAIYSGFVAQLAPTPATIAIRWRKPWKGLACASWLGCCGSVGDLVTFSNCNLSCSAPF